MSFWSLVGPDNELKTKLAAPGEKARQNTKKNPNKTGASKYYKNTQKHKPRSSSSFRRTARTNMIHSYRLTQNGTEIMVVRME